MPFYPLALGVARPERAGDLNKSSGGGGKSGAASGVSGQKLTAEAKQAIFARDDFTCQCCGFKSSKYQEIHHKNSILSDTRPENLVTVCSFCYQCFNLQTVHKMQSGVLVWLPEIDQASLHHIMRAIYVGRISQGPSAEASRKALDVIMGRREEVKRRLGTDDPYILSMILSDYLGPKHYQMRSEKLEGVRLLPQDRRIIREAGLEFNQFPQILAYWRSKDGPFGGKTPPQWISLYHSVLRAA